MYAQIPALLWMRRSGHVQICFRKNQTQSYLNRLNPLWLLPKVVVPFSIGALDAQNQCSLPASSTAAAPATPFFYSEPLKMRSAPPFPQCIISQPEFLLSRMNPEFKLVELSQKHFPSLPPPCCLKVVGGKDLWSVFTALNWSPK